MAESLHVGVTWHAVKALLTTCVVQQRGHSGVGHEARTQECKQHVCACRIPLYYELKLLLILWLIAPGTRGAEAIYHEIVMPILRNYAAKFDPTFGSQYKARSPCQFTFVMCTALRSTFFAAVPSLQCCPCVRVAMPLQTPDMLRTDRADIQLFSLCSLCLRLPYTCKTSCHQIGHYLLMNSHDTSTTDCKNAYIISYKPRPEDSCKQLA
jgi:hypothetical protein